MGSFGTTEIILIVAVLFLLFGATRLPQLAKSLGQSKKAFKEGLRDAEDEEKVETRKLNTDAAGSGVNSVSDDGFDKEMRPRSEASNT